MAKVHALVIGIDDYVDIEGFHLAPLLASVADAREVARFLAQDFPDRLELSLLLAPRGEDSDAPRPTLAGIRRHLGEIIERVQPGDQAVFYFAGHGLRLATRRPDDHPYDECLVPADIEGEIPEGVLRDLEIETWIQRVGAAGALVTCIVDGCHSGGASKELDFGWRPGEEVEYAAMGRAVRSSSWLSDPKGVVFLAACQAHQEAHQIFIDGRYRGFMTYSLLASLRDHDREATWEQIHRDVVTRVHQELGHQTPRLEGERLRHALGWEYGEATPADSPIQPDRPMTWSLMGDSSAKRRMGEEVAAHLSRQDHLTLAMEADGADFSVLRRGADWHVKSRSSQTVLSVPGDHGTLRIAEALRHLARFEFLRRLENPLSSLWRGLDLEIRRGDGSFQRLRRWDQGTDPRGYSVQVVPGGGFELAMIRRGQRVVYVTIFNFQPDAAVIQVYPSDTWAIAIEGGQRESLEVELVPTVDGRRELLLVFIASEPLDMRGFELQFSSSRTGNGSEDAFHRLCRRLAEGASLGKGAAFDWTVERIYLQIAPELPCP